MYLGSVGSYIPIIGIPIPGWMAIPLESHVTWPWHNWSHGQLEDKLGRNPLYYALGNPVPEEQWEILPLGGGYPKFGPKFDQHGPSTVNPIAKIDELGSCNRHRTKLRNTLLLGKCCAHQAPSITAGQRPLIEGERLRSELGNMGFFRGIPLSMDGLSWKISFE